MTSKTATRIRRLLRDLRRPETRGRALRRVRRRAVSELRSRVGRSAAGKHASRVVESGAAGRGAAGAAAARPPAARPAAAEPAAGSTPLSWYAREWSRLASTVLGTDPVSGTAPLDRTLAPEAISRARRNRGQAVLAAALASGEPLERAAVRAVDELTSLLEWNPAWALAEGLSRVPGGELASAIGHAVLLHRRRLFGRVWNVIRDLDDEPLATFIPVEAVDAALAAGTDAGRVRAMAIGAPTQAMTSEALVDLAGRFLAFGERELAADLAAELRRRQPADLDDRRRYAWGLIEGWLAPRPATVPRGSVPIAVLDYKTPDHVLTSGNLGDYVQTLSMLGNLVRHTEVTFTGEDGLGELATDLQQRVRPEQRVTGIGGAVHLIPVNREFSSAVDIPAETWMVAFGWHMHPLYDLRTDFPYHPNLRPLFLSFHVNRLEMLGDGALAYLRRYGPVGCRDWTTVFLLLSAGVDAFFTGCLTTTIDALFPPREAAYAGGGVIGAIDRPAPADRPERTTRLYSHQSDEYRYLSLADGLRTASTVLAGYQRDLEQVITGRLHAYLPLTSLGVPVDFKTSSPGDVRFAGLMGLRPDDSRLDELRGGIRDLTAAVLETILSGASEAEVYDRWRELTSERVADARARFETPAVVPPTSIDIDAAVGSARAGMRRFGPHDGVDPERVTDVVLCYDQNLTWPAAVLVESIVSNASAAVRLWVLTRGIDDAYREWLAGAFPDLPMTFLPCDRVTFGPAGRPRRIPNRITISTMDRLLLPRMLEDVRRVVYLDVDTVMLGDVCELANTDLQGTPVGARDSNVSESSEWRNAGRRLPEDVASELRRWMGRDHGYGGAALNAGVLVMDLDRMRRDDFTASALALIERYGLNDQDSMLAYVGPNRRVLDPNWNALPVLEDVVDPYLIHWASLGKPWEPHLTFGKDRWVPYAAALHARVGMPPTGGEDTTAPAGSLRNPTQIGAVETPLSPDLEAVIERVREEHLSYLRADALRTLAAAIKAIEADGVAGLIIEAGTARGGSAITMAAAKEAGRRMKVYDVFGMIPPPGDRDGEDVHRRYATIASGQSAGVGGETYYGYREDLLAEVTASFARHGVPPAEHNVELVKGLFEDTLALDEPVAFAHLDGDWYASTMTCLTRIAPRLSVGGRIVVDDYDTWSGCRAAVDEYFTGRHGYRFERRGRLHIVRV